MRNAENSAERASVLDSPWAAPVFIGALTLVRIVYFIFFSPYTLVEDEAHYWEWSKHLAWSYYSKGPGVAWAIAASTAVFGDVEWAVRLPAVLSGALASAAVAWAASMVFAARRAPLLAAVLFQCVPPFPLVSMLMTIDGPFVACWALACALALKARATASTGWLVATGTALAVGFLFKYTIVLLALGLVLGLASDRTRPRRFSPGAWFGFALAFALGLLPVLLWNAQYDWSTVRHLLGHLGLPGGDVPPRHGAGGWTYDPVWSLEYLAMLFIVGPVGVLGAIGFRRHAPHDPAIRLLFFASLPVLGFYLAVTLFTRAQGNWPIGGFVGFVVPATGVVLRVLEGKEGRVKRALWRLSLAVGIAAFLVLPSLPLFAKLPLLGPLIPAHRAIGMREHAEAVRERLEQLRTETGLEPFVLCSHYGRASQLAFYLPRETRIFNARSFHPRGRKAQHDLWPDRDLRRPAVFAELQGRPALILGGREPFWAQAFGTVEPLGYLRGEPNEKRSAFFGREYAGFPEPPRR